MQTESLKQPVYDLAALRDLFEVTHTGITYLNSAGMSPLPRPVKEAMIGAVEAMARDGSLVYTDLLAPLQAEALQRIGQLIHCKPEEVAFVESTSMGLNLIANSLPLTAGDQVLVCDTEFPSNVYPWQNLARKGIRTILVPSRNGGLSLEALDEFRTPRSRVVSVSGVQFFSGRREDLAALGACCKQHDLWLVVDAMQATGLTPIDMHGWGIDALAAGGQKALLGPPGQGFMAIREELIDQMHPVFAGPLSVVDHERWLRYDLTFSECARCFDMGTSNIAGLAGLVAALNLLLDLNPEHICEWVTYLSTIAIDDLQTRGYHVVTPSAAGEYAHIVTFQVTGDSAALVAGLQEAGIILRAHEDAAGNPYLRISSHAYNTVEDIQRVGKVLEELSYEQ